MTDNTELKSAASASKNWGGEVGEGRWYAAECFKRPYFSAQDAEFIAACDPGRVLALIAENERLNAECKQLILLECYGGTAQAAINLLAERDQLKAENEALRKDAEKYRWLRLADWWRSPICVIRNPKEQAKLGTDCPTGERLDRALDAAMGKGERS